MVGTVWTVHNQCCASESERILKFILDPDLDLDLALDTVSKLKLCEKSQIKHFKRINWFFCIVKHFFTVIFDSLSR
jgi:hypothetical protein